MKKILFFLPILFVSLGYSQTKTEIFNKEEININSLLKGSLYTPLKNSKKETLVILIAGSGPTDRNGNQKNVVNNSLKYLCEGLTQNDIAAFSYDKRMFAQISLGTLNEATLSFEDFINDAKAVFTYFKNQKKYNKIIIAGHSEGSLIGMIAANDNADAFISIAGPGRTIDAVVVEQIEKQAPFLKEEVLKNFEILKSGNTFELKNEMLASIFRPSVQPYMISWLKYNPQDEIKKLKIPTLLLNGTNDLQVSVGEAELLKKSKPDAELVIIDAMNHVFKEIKGDTAENMKSYNDPNLPISAQLLNTITRFIKAL
ncbi:alpha/beta hydrolase family protein [Flavobacterium sp. XS1P32]|uniref:alpha/beta hydrolase family protein n=1 Tax=unclassified Flavobacterium TaxID=196869 RepID=UPI003AAD78F0